MTPKEPRSEFEDTLETNKALEMALTRLERAALKNNPRMDLIADAQSVRSALTRLSELEGVTTMNRELLETVKLILPHLLKVTSSKAKADYWTAKHVVEKVETLAANRIAKIGGV